MELCFNEISIENNVSGNALAPNSRQAIFWTNNGPVHGRHMTLLGHNELKISRLFIFVYLYEFCIM